MVDIVSRPLIKKVRVSVYGRLTMSTIETHAWTICGLTRRLDAS